MLKRIAETHIWKWIRKDSLNFDIAKTVCSFVFNFGYAFFNLFLAWISRSIWYVTVSAFLSVLGIMRLAIVLVWRMQRMENAMRHTGILTLILSAVLLLMVYQTASQSASVGKHGDIVMITIATYTFTKLGFVIAKAVKARESAYPIAVSIRSISYAEAAISVVNLQRSMIASFGSQSPEWETMMNIITGSAACIFIAAAGISLIRKDIRKH